MKAELCLHHKYKFNGVIHKFTFLGRRVSRFLSIILTFAFLYKQTWKKRLCLGDMGTNRSLSSLGPKNPVWKMTLSQWSVANLAILYSLVNDHKLQGSSLMDCLSYTTKMYQLVQRYSLVSVLLFDREYRNLQTMMKFRWGTDVQHLSNIHLQSRDKPVVQGNQSKKVLPPNRQSTNGRNRSETAVCRNYNSKKGCTFTECKFRHVCILPGCNQSHSVLNHIIEKN